MNRAVLKRVIIGAYALIFLTLIVAFNNWVQS